MEDDFSELREAEEMAYFKASLVQMSPESFTLEYHPPNAPFRSKALLSSQGRSAPICRVAKNNSIEV